MWILVVEEWNGMERIGLDGRVSVVTYRGMLRMIRPFLLSVCERESE
jgi:hypothetical protein